MRNHLTLGALSILASFSTATWTVANADDSIQIIALRQPVVALFDTPNGQKIGEVPREALTQPWPVLQQQASGFIEAETPNGRAWIRRYAVQTDARMKVPAECGAVVTGNTKGKGVTRGLGEECQ